MQLRLFLLAGGVWMLLLGSAASAAPIVQGAFQAKRTIVLLPTGPTTAAIELSYPAHTISRPGEFAQWPLPIMLPDPSESIALSFWRGDSFVGPTAGYHFLQVLIGDKIVWENDVAGGSTGLHYMKIPISATDVPAAGQLMIVSFRLYNKKLVTNFPVNVYVAEPTLHLGRKEIKLLERTPLPQSLRWPPERPLAAYPVNGNWLKEASIIQPWGETQAIAVRQASEWAPHFAKEHGFSAIILMPPAAHNAITASAEHIAEEEFRQALALYRQAGLRLILYTSIMHMGHDPQWQFGELAQTHPEWAMRDQRGRTINLYGQPWLCPSTGALEATIAYTQQIVKAYDADAVMLDNNEFMFTEGGHWTCYCAACQQKWRQYLKERFGAKPIPGTNLLPEKAAIPQSEEESLWGLWLSFRKRIWAEACELYRQRLRKVKPDIVVLANTQYAYSSGVLAVDQQYEHLDAVLSESRGNSPRQMAAKLLLGRALACGRPLWNYIGTFNEKNYKLLRKPEEIAGLCAASMAVGANPWIVFYGFTGPENQPALAILQRYNQFWRKQAHVLGASELGGDIGYLFSTESRDLLKTPLLAPVLEALIAIGTPIRPLRDTPTLTAESLQGVRMLLAIHNPCLYEATAKRLASWIRSGGTLVISPETGWRDEYGRWRPRSLMMHYLQLKRIASGQSHKIGRGKIICVADEKEVLELVRKFNEAAAIAQTPVGVFYHRSRQGQTIIAVLGLEKEIGKILLQVPFSCTQAELYRPGADTPQPLSIQKQANGAIVVCDIPERLGLVICH